MLRKSVAEKYRKNAMITQNFLLLYTNPADGSLTSSYNKKMQYVIIKTDSREAEIESYRSFVKLAMATT